MNCPICSESLSRSDSLFRHIKTHANMLVKHLSSQEKQYAIENRIPIVWKLNKAKTAKELCFCVVCGKGAHCLQEKHKTYVIQKRTVNGKEIEVYVGNADAFYYEHKYSDCCKMFDTVAWLFDSSLKKPKKKRNAPTTSSKTKTSETKAEIPTMSEEKVKDYIAHMFESIFPLYDYDSAQDSEEDVDELEEKRKDRQQQRGMTVNDMIDEIQTQFQKVVRDRQKAVEKAKQILKNQQSSELYSKDQEISDLQKQIVEKEHTIFQLQEDLRESKQRVKSLKEELDSVRS